MKESVVTMTPRYSADDYEGPRDIKEYAVERLLDWGFDPDVIARMLGCSPLRVDAINRHWEDTRH
jgi:hypothetical protein